MDFKIPRLNLLLVKSLKQRHNLIFTIWVCSHTAGKKRYNSIKTKQSLITIKHQINVKE